MARVFKAAVHHIWTAPPPGACGFTVQLHRSSPSWRGLINPFAAGDVSRGRFSVFFFPPQALCLHIFSEDRA